MRAAFLFGATMAAAELLTDASRALDGNASPFAGAKWYFYASGTLTPQAVYADADFSTSLGAEVTADSGGRFVPIYFNAALAYRGIQKDSLGNIVPGMDIDPINSSALTQFSADIAALNESVDGLLDLSNIIPLSSATVLDADDLNKTVIISGSSSFLTNLPPASAAGQALKIYVSRAYTGVATIQAAFASGLTVDGQSAVYLISGESGTFVYDGTGWIIMDRTRVPIIAEMRKSGATSLSGSWTEVPMPTAGTQLMLTDLKALWGYSGGYFTACRPMVVRVTTNIWLTNSSTGQYDIGFVVGTTTGGSPSATGFQRVYADASTFKTGNFTGEFFMNAGEKLYLNIAAIGGVSAASVVDSATLMSRIVVEELIR